MQHVRENKLKVNQGYGPILILSHSYRFTNIYSSYNKKIYSVQRSRTLYLVIIAINLTIEDKSKEDLTRRSDLAFEVGWGRERVN